MDVWLLRMDNWIYVGLREREKRLKEHEGLKRRYFIEFVI